MNDMLKGVVHEGTLAKMTNRHEVAAPDLSISTGLGENVTSLKRLRLVILRGTRNKGEVTSPP